MQIVAQIYSDDGPALRSEVLGEAGVPQIRDRARRLLSRHPRASRVEVRYDGALMFTFLAPGLAHDAGERAQDD
jgi:hypothetical protein